jgi:hypothetical protein
VDTQGAQLAEARAENQRLWTALSAPKELQPYVAAGCSEAQAKERGCIDHRGDAGGVLSAPASGGSERSSSDQLHSRNSVAQRSGRLLGVRNGIT